jgi:DNA-binding GntR family transcriptional regulator
VATSSLGRENINRASLAESVYETLLEAMLSGTLATGVELNEVALAKQLDVSRTPVHEALRRLAADGLVKIGRHRRLRVAALSHNEVREVYAMRRLLESAAAELAAARMTDEAVADQRRAADALATARDSLDWTTRALQFDLAFHDAVAAASGNARLQQDISRYRLLVRGLCRMTGTAENLRDALAEHMEILSALERRDGRAARDAMAAHIDARLECVLSENSSSAAAP